MFINTTRPLAIAIACLSLACGSVAAMEEDLKTLRFGIIATETSENLQTSWGLLIAALEKHTGYKVEPFFAPDYGGVIEAMRFNKVEFAWYGNKSAMEAVDRSGGEIFVQTVDVEGNPGYWSLVIVHKDSPYNSIDDLVANASKLTFGNGDPNSTSGFLIPSFYLWARRGIDPVTTFKTVTSANHETNLLSVAGKKIDFATNNTESLRRLQQTDPAAASQIKTIWKSPLIPNDPFVWRKNLPDVTKQKLRAFFLAYGRLGSEAEIAEAKAVLAKTSSGFAPFVNSTNHQLLPIRQLELVKNKLSIQNSADYSDAEKKQKAAEIDKQLADLELMKTMLEAGK